MDILTHVLPLKSAILAIGCVSAVGVLFALGRSSARNWDHSCISPFGKHDGDGWSERREATVRGDD
ncbi:hypothetical protein EJC49_08885 [Aquibium carbonis]|uniref:Uncharacterized protein n=1 Tax=Aquibium carbonis TaxID=2495581 RepID=A0A429YZC4_9HYPH|nr:hypothetical protein [Aquibium carbonis]RST86811.1 hypothetical protein EJC49_08885 [Aquibium carbonis]